MDPIDRQAAIDLLKKWSDGYDYIEIETKSAIKEFQSLPPAESETCAYWDRESNICALHRPSAQPEIIHCKYCKYREHDERYGYMCSLDTGDPYELGRCAEDENWYCADAKRRED